MADLSSQPGFDLDTAVSVELDGELDGYAAELGVPVDDLRAALATPAAAARRSELGAVRRALTPDAAPSLDDLTRRRLLAGARADPAVRTGHDRGWILRAGAAAAVTLVVVAAIYAFSREPGGSTGSAAKSSGGGANTAAAPVSGDVGDLGGLDAAGISRLLRGVRTAPKSASAPEARVPQPDDAQQDLASGPGGAKAGLVSPQAVADCAGEYATQGSVRFRGSGTFGGRAAVVLGIDTARRTIVFVVAAGDCTEVLYSASR